MLYVLLAAVLCSCSTSRGSSYLADMRGDSAFIAAETSEIRLQPFDKISIVVSCRDAKLSALFNLPAVSQGVAGADTIGVQGFSQYTIDRDGNIDFPVLGTLNVAGLTRADLCRDIKRRLAEGRLLDDCVVTAEFCNLALSVLGEVRSPGRYAITRDCVTIFDAIGLAGDLTRNADRRHVTVVRREGSRQVAYEIDLTSAAGVYASPAYYLRQNDVVYVKRK
jgi:polysaccharide export outer membrane protein